MSLLSFFGQKSGQDLSVHPSPSPPVSTKVDIAKTNNNVACAASASATDWNSFLASIARMDASTLFTPSDIQIYFEYIQGRKEFTPHDQIHKALCYLLGQYLFALAVQGQPLEAAQLWGKQINLSDQAIAQLSDYILAHVKQPYKPEATKSNTTSALAKTSVSANNTQSENISPLQYQPSASAQLQTQLQTQNKSSHSGNSAIFHPPSDFQNLSVEERGLKMESAFHAQGLTGIRYISIQHGELAYPRHYCFRFYKPVQHSFSIIEKAKETILSHAGIDPEAQVIYKRLPGDQFEFQIAKPVKECKLLQLIVHLGGAKGREILTNEAPENMAFEMVRLLSNRLRFPPESDLNLSDLNNPMELILPFGVDTEGKFFNPTLTAGVFISGRPKSGKSVAFKTLIASFALKYPPHLGKLVLLDFKDGLTLSLFNKLPHMYKGKDCVYDAEGVVEVFDYLKADYTGRTALMRERGLENIYQFNQKYPDEALPICPIFLEEIAGLKRKAPGQIDFLWEIASQWRAVGFPLIASTQYSSNELGMPPALRTCFETRICFATSEQAASLVFGSDAFHCRMASKLAGSGDALIEQQGKHTRVQGFNLETEHLSQLVEAISRHWKVRV
jgi:FtsK/SpoIIIE family